MRVNGKKIEGPNVEIIAIPRGNGPTIIFQAQAVLDYSAFEKLCPQPEPPVMFKPGGVKVVDVTDISYKQELNQFALKKMAWIVLTSLSATEGLEWETVVMGDPSTWINYATELKESGFTSTEIERIVAGVFDANGLNDEKINEARSSFLASREAVKQILSSQEAGPLTT